MAENKGAEQKDASDLEALLNALRKQHPDAYRHIVGLVRSMLKR